MYDKERGGKVTFGTINSHGKRMGVEGTVRGGTGRLPREELKP